jgi:hypothetical protein
VAQTSARSPSSLPGWLLANLFLLAIALTGAGIFAACGALMWAAGLPPDDHPILTMLAAVLAIGGAWAFGRLAWQHIDRRLRRAR